MQDRSLKGVLCHGQTHVYLSGSNHCTCGLNFYDWKAVEMIFQGYNPFGPPAPKPDPPAETSLAQLRAAQRAGAGWLSADGLRAYRDDRGNPEVAFWDNEAGRFDSWWNLEDEIPAGAVLLDKE